MSEREKGGELEREGKACMLFRPHTQREAFEEGKLQLEEGEEER